MGFVKEFREFAIRGNVIDLAVGVIIGGAFGKIVSSLVEDVITPFLGLGIGKVDFASLYINLSGKEFKSIEEAKKAGASVIRYGLFLNNVLHFLIIAFAVFVMVKGMNAIRRKQSEEPVTPPAPPEPSNEEKLLTEIRDLLKSK